MCEFACKLTTTQRRLTEHDLQVLRGHDLTDRAIHDAVQVIALFNYYARLADGLGVEPETFIRPWGRA